MPLNHAGPSRSFRILILAGIVLLAPLFLALAARPASGEPSQDTSLIGLINGYRAANGLAPLVSSPTLNNAAAWKAQDMATHNYFSHTDSLGRSPGQLMTDMGYTYNVWKGENLAAGVSTAAEVLQLWQNSPAHNAILLSPNYVAVGIGSAYSAQSDYFWYWAGAFGGYDETVVEIAPPEPEPPIPPAPSTPDLTQPAPAPEPAFPPAFSGPDQSQLLPVSGLIGADPGGESQLVETRLELSPAVRQILQRAWRLSAVIRAAGSVPVQHLSAGADAQTWKRNGYVRLMQSLAELVTTRPA